MDKAMAFDGVGGGVKERECKAFFCEKRHERQAINSTVDGIFRAAKQSAGDQTDDERDSFTSAIRFRSLNEIWDGIELATVPLATREQW